MQSFTEHVERILGQIHCFTLVFYFIFIQDDTLINQIIRWIMYAVSGYRWKTIAVVFFFSQLHVISYSLLWSNTCLCPVCVFSQRTLDPSSAREQDVEAGPGGIRQWEDRAAAESTGGRQQKKEWTGDGEQVSEQHRTVQLRNISSK